MQAECCIGARACGGAPCGVQPTPPTEARGAPQAAAGSPWPWWVRSCPEVPFSAGAGAGVRGAQTSPCAGHRRGWREISPALPHCASLLLGRDSPKVYLQEKLVRSKRSKPGADPQGRVTLLGSILGREGGKDAAALPWLALPGPPTRAAFCPGFPPDPDYSSAQLVL